ncbi:MAG: alpha-N-arabinofuranosidase [Woeseiaceae bacterium]
MDASLHFSKHLKIAEVSPLIYGGFLEHMGRSIYEGVYDPDSPLADKHGLRLDVVAALSELELTSVRYPGGNFVSGYHWQDGVGPRAERPTVRELAWQSIETNQFGTDEFLELCQELGWQALLVVNLGTGSPEEARDWVEYCNAPAGTKFADMRSANGRQDPYAVPLWCLGNEMDGPWQLGHVPAKQYAIRAQQAAKMMKGVDRKLATVACGSSAPTMPTYLEWDRTVLEYLGDFVDYVSLHRYVGNHEDDTESFLGVTNSIDRQIEDVDAVCQYVAARKKLKQRPYLCFDEWNVWYKTFAPGEMNGAGEFAPHLIEEVYNLEDALVVAGFVMSFIRHADVVKIANIAQLVNVIGPLLTRQNALLKQSIFYAFRMLSSRKGGISLQSTVDGPSYETRKYGTVSYLDRAVTLQGNRLQLFLTNRSTTDALSVNVSTDLSLADVEGAEILHHEDPKAANSFENADVVVAKPFADMKLVTNGLTMTLPPLSLVAATVSVAHKT